MEKVRNHFIARVILNRFSSREEWIKKRKKCWIWQVGKDSYPLEVSTRDTALSKHFYGRPETGVEDAFQRYENSFSQILTEIDKGNRPDNYRQELNQIFWLFYIRTRALRDSFEDGFGQVLSFIPELGNTRQFKTQVLERVKMQLRDPEKIEQLTKQFSPEKRASFTALMAKTQNHEIVTQRLGEALNTVDLGPLLEAIVNITKKENVVSKAAKDAHVNALIRIMAEPKAPKLFNPTDWTLVESTDQKVILGDACMFAVSKNGAPSSILRAANNWSAFYFPISPTQILVATQGENVPMLTVDQINQASAETASSYIYASLVDEKIKCLSQDIGNKASLLTPKEAATLKKDKMDELA